MTPALIASGAQAWCRRWWAGCVACACVVGLPGCANEYYYGSRYAAPIFNTDVIKANQKAADQLLRDVPLDPQQPLMVATLVNVDRLGESSRLGRLFSEHISGRIAQKGLRVVEPRLRDALALQPTQGELLLSRELRDVGQAHAAQAVVVGTYAVSATTLYVSLKLVSPAGNSTVAAYNYAMPLDDNLRSLVGYYVP